ncbi:MAG: sugar phosphate nucleotidyltransferase [Candidatus Omnitrophota bacterium]|nr:sugar phosphate nucleotidyltransferase [Candidatus Omnitrophota bacterium]
MLWAVIMAGGRGTRFWPESRHKLPKQFLNLFGKKTLIEETVDRLTAIIPKSRMIVVTQADKVSLVARSTGIRRSQILGEPVGRNTAPCAAWGAAIALKNDANAVIALMPADHRIDNGNVFRRALKSAARVAETEGFPVTFGIQPTYAFTGYGYLEKGAKVTRQGGFTVYCLKRFHEKPTRARAKQFLRKRRFFWNSGMFVWRAENLLSATERYLPAVSRVLNRLMARGGMRQLGKLYAKMPNISIDYGLMEKLKGKILTIPVSMGWNDIGGWQALADLYPEDRNGNVLLADSVCIESSGNIVKACGKLVALVGVKNHVIVDTPDALLICSKEKTENIRSVTEHLKKNHKKRYL